MLLELIDLFLVLFAVFLELGFKLVLAKFKVREHLLILFILVLLHHDFVLVFNQLFLLFIHGILVFAKGGPDKELPITNLAHFTFHDGLIFD